MIGLKASKAMRLISKDALMQIYIQELLQKGVTHSKDGTRIEDLDYYGLRHELFLVRSRETRIDKLESTWF